MMPVEKFLFLDMARNYSDYLADQGCSDWGWPQEWSHETRKAFLKRFNTWLEATKEQDWPRVVYDKALGPPDFLVWDYLLYCLEEIV